METANNVITDALKEIAAIPSEVSITSDAAQAGIFYLNNMMADFAINGVNLGYKQINDLSDEITVEPGAIDGIVKSLALEMSPLFFDSATSQLLFNQAQEGFKSLLDIAISRPAPAPCDERMPRGSGNYDDTFGNSNFYDNALDPILTEGNSRVGKG